MLRCISTLNRCMKPLRKRQVNDAYALVHICYELKFLTPSEPGKPWPLQGCRSQQHAGLGVHGS